ncbi:DUF2799 domain-containing protein [bacterium]|nr:DUF2799 domain-containing protein [bacterium]
MRRLTIGLLGLFLAVGCTHYTLTKEQCEAGDWKGIGQSDGNQGLASAPRLVKHEEACGKHNIRVDNAAYLTGWNAGVKTYCTPSNGYNEGTNGYTYQRVCPANLEPGFLAEYEKGRKIFTVRARHQKLVSRLHDVEDDLARARLTLAKAKNSVERENATYEINKLEREKGDIDREMRLFETKHVDTLID